MNYEINKLRSKIQYLEDLLLRSKNYTEQEKLLISLRKLRVTLYKMERERAY